MIWLSSCYIIYVRHAEMAATSAEARVLSSLFSSKIYKNMVTLRRNAEHSRALTPGCPTFGKLPGPRFARSTVGSRPPPLVLGLVRPFCEGNADGLEPPPHLAHPIMQRLHVHPLVLHGSKKSGKHSSLRVHLPCSALTTQHVPRQRRHQGTCGNCDAGSSVCRSGGRPSSIPTPNQHFLGSSPRRA